MIVRVFVPKPFDRTDGSDLSGTDHEFPLLPQVGQSLQFADVTRPRYDVVRVGFIEDAETFVPAVWCTALDMPASIGEDDNDRDDNNGGDYTRYDELDRSSTGY